MKILFFGLSVCVATVFGDLIFPINGVANKGIDVIYQGDACSCGSKLPYHLEIPKPNQREDAHYDYSYKIDVPQKPPTELKYSFDFHMERPRDTEEAPL